ncbi:unnamed protein product, partial [Ilex paraguariensis]
MGMGWWNILLFTSNLSIGQPIVDSLEFLQGLYICRSIPFRSSSSNLWCLTLVVVAAAVELGVVNFNLMGLCFTKLFGRLFLKREIQILLVGLSIAGKTTIMYKLKSGEVGTTTPTPTIGFNVETVEYNNINFVVFDIGGYDLRFVEVLLPQHTQGLIFVVDSNDRDRVVDARETLHRLLSEDELRDVVLLVFANKQDLPNAMNAGEISDKLDLHSLRQRHWYIQTTCATSGEGLYEGLDWLSNKISNK